MPLQSFSTYSMTRGHLQYMSMELFYLLICKDNIYEEKFEVCGKQILMKKYF